MSSPRDYRVSGESAVTPKDSSQTSRLYPTDTQAPAPCDRRALPPVHDRFPAEPAFAPGTSLPKDQRSGLMDQTPGSANSASPLRSNWVLRGYSERLPSRPERSGNCETRSKLHSAPLCRRNPRTTTRYASRQAGGNARAVLPCCDTVSIRPLCCRVQLADTGRF